MSDDVEPFPPAVRPPAAEHAAEEDATQPRRDHAEPPAWPPSSQQPAWSSDGPTQPVASQPSWGAPDPGTPGAGAPRWGTPDSTRAAGEWSVPGAGSATPPWAPASASGWSEPGASGWQGDPTPAGWQGDPTPAGWQGRSAASGEGWQGRSAASGEGWQGGSAAGGEGWQGGGWQSAPGGGWGGGAPGGWQSGPGAGWGGGGGGWGAPGGGWGQPWGHAPGDQDPVTPRRGRRGIAAALVAVVLAAFIGVGIGRAINSTRTITVTPNSPFQPFTPGNRNGNGGSTNPGSSSGGANSATVSNVEKGVVDINTKLGYQSATAAGTGMVLTPNGKVLTNNHVIDGATTISATVVTTGKTYTAKVVGVNPTADVALLQLEGASGLSTIPLGNSSSVQTGDAVTAIGNAGGVGGAPSVVTGQVLATGQSITASDVGGANAERLSNLIEMNAPIEPGDSGGPLVDSSGKVVGMNTAASTSGRFQVAANTAFAIPINDAMTIVHQIERGEESDTVHLGLPGFLGVAVNPQGTASGALISNVVSGSAAAKAGIAEGDVITSVNGKQVSQASDLTTLLQSHHPGDKVTITWSDQSGSSHTATVTLGTGPAN